MGGKQTLAVEHCPRGESMDRRSVLKSALAAGALALPGRYGQLLARPPLGLRRPRPGMPGWPSLSEWARLNAAVNGRLIRPASQLKECVSAGGPLCDALF